MSLSEQKYLQNLKSQLLNKNNWMQVILSREWTKQIPTTAGVYILIDKNEIVYVGETGNLKGRMEDLLDSRRHCVRRTIGEKFFSTYEGFQKATARIKFPNHIEVFVNDHIKNNFKFSCVEVSLGRKELEELVQNEINNNTSLNKRGKRNK